MTGREPRGDESHASQASQSAYWARLYEQCHRQLRAYFARNVRCAHDADDLVQEVFASLLLRGGRLQEPMVYIRAVARHQLRAYWRHTGRRNLVLERAGSICHDDLLADWMYCDRNSDPLIQLGDREMRQIVLLLMDSLPPALAEILKLRYIKGMDPEEAASQTGCSPAAIKKRLTRAKQSLAKLCTSRLRDRDVLLHSVVLHDSHRGLMRW